MTQHPQPSGPPRPEIAELAWIAVELARLDEARHQLLARREVLLAALMRPPVPVAAPVPPGPGREVSRRGAAALLLAVGGLLVVVAAAVFTAANWSSLGPGRQAAILLVVSAVALATPWPLARRGLAATAEAAAAVGLALTVVSAGLLAGLVHVPVSGWLVASATVAGLAAVWAGYRRAAPVRGPGLAAAVAAQFALPLAATALSPPLVPVAIALCVTAAGDLGLAAWSGHRQQRAERLAACLLAVLTWSAAILVAAVAELAGQRGPWLLAGCFLLAGGIALASGPVVRASAALAGPAAWISGVLITVGLAIPAAAALPAGWRIGAFAVAGGMVAALACWPEPAVASGQAEPVGASGPVASGPAAAGDRTALARAAAAVLAGRTRPLALGGAAVLAGCGFVVAPVGLVGLLRPLGWTGHGWPGRALLAPAAAGSGWAGSAVTLMVLGLVSLALWLAPLGWPRQRRPARAAALVTGALAGGAAATLPAVAAPAGWPAGLASLAVLALAALAQLAAAGLASRWPRPALAVELAGWAVAVPATAAGLTGPGPAVTVLAASAVLCLGAALRPGRRFLLWPGLALADAAWSAGLAAHGVLAPEPYTVPAAAILLAAGWQWSRRSPEVVSWLTYGPGIVALLLPTLAAAWPQEGWARPLALGVTAATVMVAGARARLAAPLLLGGAVTLLDAVHELAPAITGLAGMAPRWVPIALAGLVLIILGATYEARLRDLRRLRAALAGLR